MTRFALLTCAIQMLLAAMASAQTYLVMAEATANPLPIHTEIWNYPSPQEAPVVGHIPVDGSKVSTTGSTLVLENTVWREIIYDGHSGWVEESDLRLIDYPVFDSNLSCFGAEPFWSLSIEHGHGRLEKPTGSDIIDLGPAAIQIGQGRRDLWSVAFGSSDVKITSILQYTRKCTDGMSDFVSDFELFLIDIGAQDGPAQACCGMN